MSRRVRKKPEETENKENEGKTSLVDQILSRDYWKKKRKIRRRKRLAKKKLEEKMRIEEEINQRFCLGESADLGDDNVEITRTNSNRNNRNHVDLRKEVENVLREESAEDVEQKDDKIWDVKDGLFNEGDIVDIEKRTNQLLDDRNVPNEDFDDEFSEKNFAYIIDKRAFLRVEQDLNEIFGINPEPEEEEIDNTLSLNSSLGSNKSEGEDNQPRNTDGRKGRTAQEGEETQEHKSVLDMILSPGYFKKKRRKKKSTNPRRRRRVKK